MPEQYSNRSDLRQAPKAASGQTYGKAKQQIDAQRAIPVAAPSLPSVAAPVAGQGTGLTAGPLPGSLGWDGPSDRPDEPVTAGLSVGPGGGPEMLPPADTGLADIEPYLPALEVMASQPGSSQQLRQLVRRIRSGQG